MGKRILIVRTDRVGDIVMITPMIREIKKAFPDAYTAVLAQPNPSKVLYHNPYLDRIITDDLTKESFRRVIKEIQSEKFDYGLLVWPTKRAAYQMFLAGVKTRINVGRKVYGFITLMKRVSRNNYNPLRHEADYCMDLARKIGVVTDNIQPEIFVSDEERRRAEDIYLKSAANHESFRIIIHTGSGMSAPNWSEEKYFRLIQETVSRFRDIDFNIFLTASEMSEKFRRKIRHSDLGKVHFAADETRDIRDLIAFINSADLMISSSTGPAHIADGVGTSCIVIHCHRPMNCARHWGILNRKSVNLEVSEEYCNSNCSDDKKICNFEDGITTDEIIRNINFKQKNEIRRH